MLVCNYCGRNYKKEYETCPGCGSTSFKKTSNFGEKVIKKPPEGGYKINVESFEKEKKGARIIETIGWIFAAFMIVFDLPFFLGGLLTMGADALFGISFMSIAFVSTIPFVGIGIGLIIFGKKKKKKAEEEIKRVQKLAKEGILVKNMPYQLVKTGVVVNNQPVYCFKVQYENASGQRIPLKSEAKYDNKLSDKNGTVDLLIDPEDYSNYYIDLEIY